MNNFLKSSLGKKAVMSLTGLFLFMFLLEHLYTNVKLFYGDGGIAFNEASHDMVHTLLIRIIEIFLFLAIVVHVYQALYLTRANSDARPVKYTIKAGLSTSPWASRNMGLTGSLIFFFIVVHLYNFFVPYRITHTVGNDGQAQTLAQNVAEAMADPIYAGIYIISLIFLAIHLSHGIDSALQTLGLNNKKYAPTFKRVGALMAWVVIGLGFASFPIIFYVGKLMGWDVLNWAM